MIAKWTVRSARGTWRLVRAGGLNDGFRLAKLALVAAILFQYVNWFGTYWQPDTVRLVRYAVVAFFAVEAMAKLRAWHRRILQAAALLVGCGVILHIHQAVAWSGEGWRQRAGSLAESLFRWLVHYVDRATPYFWFGLAAGAIAVALVHWLNNRIKTIALIVSTVVLFAGVDSFSLLYFWNWTAAVVLSGLLLLVCEHLRGFKERHPDSWSYFRQYPGILLTTLVVLLAAVSAGMLAPNVKPLLTDPYTAIMKMEGQPVNVPGKGWEAPQLKSHYTSGYSRDDSHLGGAFDFDYSPIMTVNTSYRSYWRGEIRSYYDGKGWEQTERDDGFVPLAPGPELKLDESGIDVSKRKTQTVTQTVTMLRNEAYPVLFGAYPIATLTEIDGDVRNLDAKAENASATPPPVASYYISRLSWSPTTGELRWRSGGQIKYPKTYTITSEIPIFDEKELRSAPAPAHLEALQDELQLPDELPARVGQLARDIAKDAATPYDKVAAIEDYLHKNYTYTNEPDITKGHSPDFADRFLFEIKEGYCDYFSTAMTVMVRSLGIPARWVKGYSSGSLPEDIYLDQRLGRDIDPNIGGEYTVRNADAHSWVEVYFEGYGWIPFEPTPGFVMPRAEPAEPADLGNAPALAGDGAADDSAGAPHWLRPAAATAAVAVLPAAALLLAWRRYGSPRRWFARRIRTVDDYKKSIVVEFDRCVRKLRKKGLERSPYETARESMRRWGEGNLWMRPHLDTMADLFERAKYSAADLGEEEYARWKDAVERVRNMA